MLRALIAALVSAPLTFASAAAQDWPSRTINVIVPLGAGSASDIVARVVMEQVGKQLGQAAVVENRPGAGGTIGANMVAKAAPDGYTILVYGALASAHALHEKLPYDSVNDLIPVASKTSAFGRISLDATPSVAVLNEAPMSRSSAWTALPACRASPRGCASR